MKTTIKNMSLIRNLLIECIRRRKSLKVVIRFLQMKYNISLSENYIQNQIKELEFG